MDQEVHFTETSEYGWKNWCLSIGVEEHLPSFSLSYVLVPHSGSLDTLGIRFKTLWSWHREKQNHVKNHKPGIDLSVKCIAEVFLIFLFFSVFLFFLRRLLTKKNPLVLLYFYVNFLQILFIRMKFDTVNCRRHHSQ